MNETKRIVSNLSFDDLVALETIAKRTRSSNFRSTIFWKSLKIFSIYVKISAIKYYTLIQVNRYLNVCRFAKEFYELIQKYLKKSNYQTSSLKMRKLIALMSKLEDYKNVNKQECALAFLQIINSNSDTDWMRNLFFFKVYL